MTSIRINEMVIGIEDKIEIEVDNCGTITFINRAGDVTTITVHPKDLKSLLDFLIGEGYKLSG